MDTYEIKDLYLAAICIAGGCKFTGLKVLRPGYYTFNFTNPPIFCESIIEQFRVGKLIVPANTVIDAISLLKHEMNKEAKND